MEELIDRAVDHVGSGKGLNDLYKGLEIARRETIIVPDKRNISPAGQIDCAIAAGVDTVSDPPVVYPKSFQQRLLQSYRGRTLSERVGPWFGLRPRDFRPVLPGIAEPRTGLSMGPHPLAEVISMRVNVSYRDKDGEISRKYGDMPISALRTSYGNRFAKGVPTTRG